MLTEIWLNSQKNNIRLPILPSEFENVTSSSFASNKIQGLGDVATFDGNGLAKITLSSFYPSNRHEFNNHNTLLAPYDFVSVLAYWRKYGTVIRVIFTGTDVNMEMIVTDFNYGERDGTGNVHYEISLIEYRKVNIPQINTSSSNGTNNNSSTQRPTPPPTTTQRTHKVQPNESLWSIAQKYYGNGNLYPKIKDANSSKYPSLKTSNIIYSQGSKAMTLVIP